MSARAAPGFAIRHWSMWMIASPVTVRSCSRRRSLTWATVPSMEFSTGRTAWVAAPESTASKASRNSRQGIGSTVSPKTAATASSLYAPRSPWYATFARGRRDVTRLASPVGPRSLVRELRRPLGRRDDPVADRLGYAAGLHDLPAGLRRPVRRRDHLEQGHRVDRVAEQELRGPLHRLEGELVRALLRQARADPAFDHVVREGRDESGPAPAQARDRVEHGLLDHRHAAECPEQFLD